MRLRICVIHFCCCLFAWQSITYEKYSKWTINNNNDMYVHLPRPLSRRIHSIIPTYINWSVQWHKLVTILKFNNAVQQKQNTLFHTSVFWWSDTLGWIQPCSIVPILQTNKKIGVSENYITIINNKICLYGCLKNGGVNVLNKFCSHVIEIVLSLIARNYCDVGPYSDSSILQL